MVGLPQIILIATVILGITVFALVDILKSEFSGNNKMIWVIVVLVTNIFGALLYLVIGRQQKVSVSK